jgi:hypothetical protein
MKPRIIKRDGMWYVTFPGDGSILSVFGIHAWDTWGQAFNHALSWIGMREFRYQR